MSKVSEAAVSEKPILFSGPMVRAIFNGKKTQTRRIMKPQPHVDGNRVTWFPKSSKPDDVGLMHPMAMWRNDMPIKETGAACIDKICPFGCIGSHLWVREAWAPMSTFDPSPETGAIYRADNHPSQKVIPVKWTPSIHMPRWASRITLEITDVRVEQLNDISEADASLEGVDRLEYEPKTLNGMPVHPRTSYYWEAFKKLWESINGAGAWDLNPWVWVVSFRRIGG